MDKHWVDGHPAVVLNKYAAAAYASDGDSSEYGRAYTTAATRLRGYEMERGITFVAIDDKVLADVVRAYDALEDAPNIRATNEFEKAALRALGLND